MVSDFNLMPPTKPTKDECMPPNTEASQKNELELMRLEGVIREGFATISGELKLHTEQTRNISNNVEKVANEVKAVSKQLEEHLLSERPHAQCEKSLADINNAHETIREVKDTRVPSLESRLGKVEVNEKIQKGQIQVLKWLLGSGILVGVLLSARDFVTWILQK